MNGIVNKLNLSNHLTLRQHSDKLMLRTEHIVINIENN